MALYIRPAVVIFISFILGILTFLALMDLAFNFIDMILPGDLSVFAFMNFAFPDTLFLLIKLFLIVITVFIVFSISYYVVVFLIASAAKRALKKVKIGIYKTNNIFFDAHYKDYLRANIYIEVVDRLIMIFPYLRVHILRKLGCKIGKNVSLGGIIREPYLVEIEDGVVIGYKALISGHAQNRGEFVMGPVKIRKNAIIGANAILFPYVEVGEGAVVGAGAVVVTNTKIPPNTLYAGIPAREITKYPELNIQPGIIDPNEWLKEKEARRKMMSSN